MLKKSTYLKLIRLSAWYDLIVTGGFATPWSLALIIGSLNRLHLSLGLPGETVVLTPYATLFGSFFGSVVMIWSVYRLRHTSVTLGRYDGVGRVLFSLWQVNALLNGASLLLLPVLMVEIGFGIAQWLPIYNDTDG